MREHRKPTYEIEPLIVNRWSPRALDGRPIPENDLMALFEAARWAPSSYNNQPWRFLYARRDTTDWPKFLDLLVEGNRAWAKNAAVLIVIVSRKTFEYNGKPSRTHSFDAGSAWENLALEATARGLVAHGMEGFDYEKAQKVLEIPEDYAVEAMAAVGRRGRTQDLPEKLRKGEVPNDRKPLKDILMEGRFRT